ncbi:conserved hypothetical protein [Magnetococcus marinus MC-1]|uniref:DUF3037 domain-containing protein n=1 Tax=Magnetococcus marinus (strain ATCC BAA-1437 / JCM 17883 / MC-1) TaxID=156889 RepID=A0L6J3_MAGMM|nr:DUF3037 domain-containing protein [Magnetococcus marinus]ABK43586.1 conserved hypothetical protein [Magnetococcus marinus MC-1]
MEKIACQYTIVRFAPFVETGEFANVGILMIAPDQRFFAFNLETRRYARITHFFDELDPQIYCASLHALKGEFERVQRLLNDHDFYGRTKNVTADFVREMFGEIVRPREGIIRYAEPRIVLTEDPKQKLNDLFAFYVERNFITKQYEECVLEKGMRKWLSRVQLGDRFHKMPIGDAEYHATFPFVQVDHDTPVKIIKPLHLAQSKPSKIIDHGGTWAFRLTELSRRKTLPEKVLFSVSGPDQMDEKRYAAFEKAVDCLKHTGIEVVNHTNRDRVLAFAGA